MHARTLLTAAAAALFTCLIASPSEAALLFYMKVKGQRQGDIKGNVVQKGREDTILCTAFSHNIVSPRDAATGRPVGKRLHKPMVITTEWGRHVPLLMSALTTNEVLTEVELWFFSPSSTGIETRFMTIKLINASIAELSSKVLNVRSPELARMPETCELSLTYERIEVTYTNGGLSYTDTWASVSAPARQPVARSLPPSKPRAQKKPVRVAGR
jgi:type VI secretion system secreted protein Hcp